MVSGYFVRDAESRVGVRRKPPAVATPQRVGVEPERHAVEHLREASRAGEAETLARSAVDHRPRAALDAAGPDDLHGAFQVGRVVEHRDPAVPTFDDLAPAHACT